MSEQVIDGGNLLTVPKAGLKAIAFVFRKFRFFVLRVLPAFVAIGLVELLPLYLYNLPVELGYVYWILKNLAYVAFIVSWHRYTLLPAERRRDGLVLSYGLREMKAGAILLAVYFIHYGCFQIIRSVAPKAFLGYGYAACEYLFFLLSSLLLFFVYPAIALDQPIRLKLFWTRAFRLFFSFVLASLIALVVIVIEGFLQFGLSYLFGNQVAGSIWSIMPALMFWHLITFLELAFLASTASFLFRDMIGLQGEAVTPSPPE